MADRPEQAWLGTASCCDQLHVSQEGNLHRNQRQFGPRRLLAVAALSLFVLGACNGNAPATTSSAIKIGILSDCFGYFGSFYNDDLGGALALLASHYGGKASGSLPKDGMTGVKIAGKDVQIVGFGCSDSTARQAIEEARRRGGH